MKRLISICLILLLAACATTPQVTPVIPKSYSNVDYNKIWAAAIDTLDESGFTIAQMSKEDGYISTNMLDTTGREGISNASYGQQHGFTAVLKERSKISVRIAKESNITVKVTATLEHYMSSGIGALRPDELSNWKTVESNGLLEKKIQDKIAAKLDN